VGITPFVDLSPEEFRSSYGISEYYKTANASVVWGGLGEVEEPPLLGASALPDAVDWRREGAVSVVQNQGHCGSCWSFATAGAVEGAWKVLGGDLYTLSEQQLVDCAGEAYHNLGCHGGNAINGFAYISQNGLCTARSYQYVAVQGSCRADSCQQVIPRGGVTDFRLVDHNNENALMQAVAQQPVAVAINGDSLVFQTYRGGIISQNCGTTLDHGVLLVGYGTDAGRTYWIIKNSWGVMWGEDGYGRLARGISGPGECGILTQASYPILNRSKVVPGSFNLDPGTVAAIAFAALFGVGALVFCYSQFCKGRLRRQPLLTPSPAAQASPNAMPNPWASRQAVTPAPAPSAPPAPVTGVPVVNATQVRKGNSAASRILNQ